MKAMVRVFVRRWALVVVSVLLVGCGAGAPPAAGRRIVIPGPSGNKALAQRDLEEGERRMREGDYARACDKLNSSERLDHSKKTVFRLGECYEQIKKYASAYERFIQAAEEAKKEGKPDHERDARERAQRVFPFLHTKLVIDVPEDAIVDGLTVIRDDVQIPVDQWSREVPVDPGDHTIVANAPGRSPWQTSIRVEEGEVRRLTVPELARLPMSPKRVGAVVTGSLGAASLIVGVACGIVAFEEWRPIKQTCGAGLEACRLGEPGSLYSADLEQKKDRALAASHASTAGFIAGGAGIAAALILLLTDSPSSPSSSTVGIAPAVGPTSATITMHADF